MAETFEQFLYGPEGVMASVAPEGAADELVTAHLQDARAALIDVQRAVAYYRKRSKDTFPFCSTLFSCGATVIEAPRGHIQRVYTLEAMCCPVFYEFVTDYDSFINWLNGNRVKWTDPANEDMPPLPRPFKHSESSLDKGDRYNWGKWTLHNQRIYLGQRIESTETVIVEYEAVKRSWQMSDLMPYDDDSSDASDKGIELKRAVASWVRKEHLRKYERDERGFALEQAVYDNIIAEMKLEEWREKIPKVQVAPRFEPHNVSGESTCRSAECAAVTSPLSGSFAIIGDWGYLADSTNGLAVEALVKTWSPDFIVTAGDNRYGDYTYDELFAAFEYYNTFVDRGLLFPAIGNHDTDDNDGVAGFLAAFPYLPSGGRNYDIQLGNVHFFFRETHDNGTNPPSAAALALSSAQLRVRLASSKAPWRVVITQDPPYDSDEDPGNYPGHVNAQLPYKLWGADVVISGDSHYYERLLVDGFPYLVNGSGGATPNGFNTTPAEGSLIRYNESYGAIRGRATCDGLVLEFFNVAGVLIDTLALGETLAEAVAQAVETPDDNVTIVQNVTNIVNNITGSTTHFGGFTDPNGNVAGNEGDGYRSRVSLGGDGTRWDCVTTGTAATAVWE